MKEIVETENFKTRSKFRQGKTDLFSTVCESIVLEVQIDQYKSGVLAPGLVTIPLIRKYLQPGQYHLDHYAELKAARPAPARAKAMLALLTRLNEAKKREYHLPDDEPDSSPSEAAEPEKMGARKRTEMRKRTTKTATMKRHHPARVDPPPPPWKSTERARKRQNLRASVPGWMTRSNSLRLLLPPPNSKRLRLSLTLPCLPSPLRLSLTSPLRLSLPSPLRLSLPSPLRLSLPLLLPPMISNPPANSPRRNATTFCANFSVRFWT